MYQKILNNIKFEILIKISTKNYIYLFKFLILFIIFIEFCYNSKLILINEINYKKILKNENINLNYKLPDDESNECKYLDPLKLFKERMNTNKDILCQSRNSKHICYINKNNYYKIKNGVICKMENFILDPLKWKDDGYIYKGPVNKKTKGCPLISKGFFNMKCNKIKKCYGYSFYYKNYFKAWNYYKNNIYNEKEEELAPGKTILFISRNQDSPNLFWGGAAFINALSLIYYFNLNPDKITVVFLESMKIYNDPFFYLYKKIISRGGTPLHVRNLKKKYHISSAFHVPINWDSACFNKGMIFNCKYQSKTFYLLNKNIDKYMNIKKFIEPIYYNKEIFYYPKTINNPNSSKYKKFITFQWRKVWPKGRKGQTRILGNATQLIDKLASCLPGNVLVRLVDTAQLNISEQISIMKKTDYFIGVHGAGLFLSIFMPINSILQEISFGKKTTNLLKMSRLSGHIAYGDVIKANIESISDNEYIFFDSNNLTITILEHMKKNNFFN